MNATAEQVKLAHPLVSGRWNLWHWLIAVMLVGQIFQHYVFLNLGGVSRDNPMGLTLLLIFGFFAFILINNIMQYGGFFACLDRRCLRVLTAAILFGLVLAMGILYTPAPKYGVTKTMGYFLFNLIPLFLILITVNTTDDIIHLCKAIYIVGFLASLITFAATLILAGGLSSLGVIWQTKLFFYVLGTKIDLGIWLARRMIFLTITGITLFYFLPKYRKVLIITMLWFIYLAILSGARGPFYFGIVTLFIMGYLLAKSESYRKLFEYGMVVMVVLIVLKHIFFMPVFKVGGSLPVPLEVRQRYDASLEDPEQSWAIRLDLFKSAAEVFLQNSFVGIGTGGWTYAYNRVDQRDYPHNIFLEIASELGVVGLAAFMFLLLTGYSDYKTIIKSCERGSAIYIIGAFGAGVTVLGLSNAQVSGDIIGNEHIWVGLAFLTKAASLRDKAIMFQEA